jgi:hypothetical protein
LTELFGKAFEDLAVFFEALLQAVFEGFVGASAGDVVGDSFANRLGHSYFIRACHGSDFVSQLLRKTEAHDPASTGLRHAAMVGNIGI